MSKLLSDAVDITKVEPADKVALLAERFWAKVDKTPDCWVWTGSRVHAGGYGQIANVPASPLRAHRLSLYLHGGPVPRDLHVDHLCRNPACVRPDHLELVSQAENNRRAAAVRQKATHCPQGHELRITRSRNGWRRTVCNPCHAEASKRSYWKKVSQ